MAEWAYACRQPGKDQDVLYISAMAISDLPAEQLVVRVKVGAEWRCAVIDRSRRLEVASQLIRPVIASSLDDCPQCEPLLQADDSATQDIAAVARTTSSAASADSAGATTIQVAMLHDVGDGVALILVPLSLVQSPGEAAMAVEDLQLYFSGMRVVLVAQDDSGNPVYHGDSALVRQFAKRQLEEMPWEDHRLA